MAGIERLYQMSSFGTLDVTPKESDALKEGEVELKESEEKRAKKLKHEENKKLFNTHGLNIKNFSIPEKCVCGNKLENIEMKKDIISGHEIVFIVLSCKCGRLNYPSKKI